MGGIKEAFMAKLGEDGMAMRIRGSSVVASYGALFAGLLGGSIGCRETPTAAPIATRPIPKHTTAATRSKGQEIADVLAQLRTGNFDPTDFALCGTNACGGAYPCFLVVDFTAEGAWMRGRESSR